jgi:hypothetical protein
LPFKIVFATVLALRPAELADVVGAISARVNKIVKIVKVRFFKGGLHSQVMATILRVCREVINHASPPGLTERTGAYA